jgi:hypothetical protein
MRFQCFNPGEPGPTDNGLLFLDSWLKPSAVGLEWGSGHSTAWFARRVAHLTSIEDNLEWFDTVSRVLAGSNLGCKVDYRFIPCQLREQDEPDSHPYAEVTGGLGDKTLVFALVNGNIRATCFRNVLPKIEPGGLLILANASRYVPHHIGGRVTTVQKSSAEPFSPAWAELMCQLESWHSVFTTDGNSDTRFWVRPLRLDLYPDGERRRPT